jgi:antitoxin component YwqK of YwqJK toxin-antitoxin module
MQSYRLASLFASGVVLLIGCAPSQQGLPNAPIFNTGARATIISPSQNAPVMPGQQMPGAAAGSASGSYGSSSSGYPGGYPGGPGAPPPGTPPSAYGNPGDLSMLGGAVTVDTREIKKPRNALRSNPLFWPFAVVAWPFEKIGEAIDGDDEQEQLDRRARAIVESGGAPMYHGGSPRAQAQMAQEHAQNEAMRREIAMRNAGGQDLASASRAAVPSSGGSLSIADELAALRSSAASRPAPAGTAAPSGAAADETDDRDGDGQVDVWRYERDGALAREVFDDNADGVADRSVHYEPGGKRIARVEQDGDGDGATDSWVLYQDGKMSQRRSDTNQDGQVDAWVFYDESGRIARQAQDMDGDGSRDRAEVFENGKLARRTEDLDGDGRPDRMTRFDAEGNAVETEEDKDGDGQIDVRSFYSDGRLVKRQLLDEEAQEATP